MNLLKYSVKNHKKIKEFILKEIEKYPDNEEKNLSEYGAPIHKTDFFDKFYNEPQGPDPYFLYFDECEPEFHEFMKKTYAIHGFQMVGHWFQQYTRNHEHGWHTHPRSNLSLVYFVELDDPSLVTEFYDVYEKKIFQPDAKEGDIVVFDSYMPHRAPINLTDTRKTIMSVNLNIELSIDNEVFKDVIKNATKINR